MKCASATSGSGSGMGVGSDSISHHNSITKPISMSMSMSKKRSIRSSKDQIGIDMKAGGAVAANVNGAAKNTKKKFNVKKDKKEKVAQTNINEEQEQSSLTITENSNENTQSVKNNNKDKINFINPWSLIESYFSSQHLKQMVRHQIESYNDFVTTQIKKTINMFNPVHIKSIHDYDEETKKYGLEMIITFENFHIYRPQAYENNGSTKIMFPQEARIRNFTYASTMTIDLNIKIIRRYGENMTQAHTQYKTLPKIHIGKLPIMLKSCICVLNQYKHLDHHISGECKYDAGGYFIINGSEKTVLAQERAAENKVYCFNTEKDNNKWLWVSEIKSVPDHKIISPKEINLMIGKRNNGFGHGIYVNIPQVTKPIPLFVLFRALGIISDKEICRYILLQVDDASGDSGAGGAGGAGGAENAAEFKYHKNNSVSHSQSTQSADIGEEDGDSNNNDNDNDNDKNDSIQTKLIYALRGSIVDANTILSQESAFEYINAIVDFTPKNMTEEEGKKKKKEFTEEILDNNLFPHCKTKTQKVYFLGYMSKQIVMSYLGMRPKDDRDNYKNKRIDLTGTLLNNLFRNYFNKLVKDMQKQIIKEINNGSWRSTDDYMNIITKTNIYKIVKSATIENGLKRALATGDFGIKGTKSNKVGVAQVLNRLTYISSLSHLRRINTPIDKNGKLEPPRQLHNSSWGFICPAETPEGASVGVVKNISYMAHVTIPSNSKSIYDLLAKHKDVIAIEYSTPEDLFNKVKIFVNGCWIAITEEPELVYEYMKKMKYSGIINIYTGIVFDYRYKEIRICNESGRIMRPLLRVVRQMQGVQGVYGAQEQNQLLITPDIISRVENGSLEWNDLLVNHKLENSVIEYIDAEEQNYSMIAMKQSNLVVSNGDPSMCIRRRGFGHGTSLSSSSTSNMYYKYTHCEIHPSTIFGVLASCIPFPEHNQSPRNTYQCIDSREFVIMANGEYKRLYDITIGDYVKTFDTNGNIVNARVIKTRTEYTFKRCYELTVDNFRGKEFKVKATYDHKFYTYDGWKMLEDIQDYRANNCDYVAFYKDALYDAQLPLNGADAVTGVGDGIEDIGELCFMRVLKKELFNDTFTLNASGQQNEFGFEVTDITVNHPNHSFILKKGFCVHNCAMGKQAMGMYVTNYDKRMDKTSYVLTYAMRPLVDTRVMNILKLNNIPSGEMVIVAIGTYTGYNQEDSIIFNKGSLDRGLFSATIYHTEKDEDKKVYGDEEIRCQPDSSKTKGMKFANYNKLDNHGLVPENTLIENKDIIIGKVVPIKENKNDHTKLIKYSDQSRIYRTNEETYIDKNIIDRNGDGYTFCKVRLRAYRKPIIGDKFSSRHGQKGTIGVILPEEDIPFTADGLKPDLIINPHAIPSRMTIGQLKETLLGKVLIELGMFGDGTSFNELDVRDIADELMKHGYEKHGNQMLMNGMTGMQLESDIFIGPVFYQRLKHMVNDKQHSRSFGPKVKLTRQPPEGRSRDGGLRFGEMERDCTVSHGAARFTKGRLYDASDKYEVVVCKKCGMFASYNDKKGIHDCKMCDNKIEFSRVQIPYACKLLFQELITMNIAPRMLTTE
jgi:DNA-directed RNA polymerase beta subunit